MTYNFDPERWYDNELAALEREYRAGGLDRTQLENRTLELDARLEEMWRRLDPSYRVCAPDA